MIVKDAHIIYFSPTHTSEQVAKAIVRGTGIEEVQITDITLQPADELVLPESSLAIIAVPVYGGHVAPLAMERLRNIRGTNTPTVIVVIYGNRAYEKALMELDEYALPNGFKIIAGGTFIGEHSYSTAEHPISAGRPSVDDLELACAFGNRVMQKIEAATEPDKLYPVDVRNIPRPRQPFFTLLRFARKVMALRKSGKPFPAAPGVEEGKCTHCGYCALHCPAKAIAKGNELHTDASLCIKCCACVKQCPQRARTYDSPFGELLAKYFTRQKEPKTIL